MLLLKLALELRPELPTLFLDTGYHFAETYAYRDRIAREWNVKLINLLPLTDGGGAGGRARAALSDEPGSLLRARKVEPLFRAVANYKVWITGLRREQANTPRGAGRVCALYAARREAGVKLSPLADFTTADVWHACEHLEIPLLPLYARGYSSIGCEPCTSLPLDPGDARSGRWGGRKVECGIHIEAAK